MKILENNNQMKFLSYYYKLQEHLQEHSTCMRIISNWIKNKQNKSSIFCTIPIKAIKTLIICLRLIGIASK